MERLFWHVGSVFVCIMLSHRIAFSLKMSTLCTLWEFKCQMRTVQLFVMTQKSLYSAVLSFSLNLMILSSQLNVCQKVTNVAVG
jgi:hypothetical protein